MMVDEMKIRNTKKTRLEKKITYEVGMYFMTKIKIKQTKECTLSDKLLNDQEKCQI